MRTGPRTFTRKLFFVSIVFALTVSARTQTFDTSGNENLKGDYFVRQVIAADLDPMTSAIGRAYSLTGVMTFDGQGNYSFIGQMMDTQSGSTAKPYTASGIYSVASDGLALIQNPIDSQQTEHGAIAGLGPTAIIASATEGNYRDLFVAIEAGSSASNSTVSGSYQAGFIDFLEGNASQVRDGYATLTSAGSGGFGNVTVNGAMANETNASVQQTLNAVTYSITGNGSGTLTFPTSTTPLAALVSGQKTLYVSSDGNLLLAGDPNGFDILVGMKSGSAPASNSMYQGTYFSAGLGNNLAGAAPGSNDINSFYGSTLALGDQGAGVSHFRMAYFGQSPYDFTTNIAFNFAADGTYNDGTYQYLLAANGQAELQVGTGSIYALILEIVSPSVPLLTQGPAIFPAKIFNAGNYAPITNPVAPGEFITIFGANLAAAPQSANVPLPTILGGVKVTVNGRPAPISFVSPTHVNILIPYATVSANAVSQSYATLQVFTNGAGSNQVMLYANLSAPGVFALTNNDGTFAPGIGPAAVLHADYLLVTAEHPATAGETLLLYVTGLGAVTPPVADGAAAPSNPPSTVNDSVSVDILSLDILGNYLDSTAVVAFAGLAPGFAGLYQVNFTVPSGVTSGTAYVNVSTNEGTTSEALLYIQ
ncbi:MAG: hypothetical protein ACLPWF_13200 [Bryobacteraceae bacterium]